MRNFPGHVPLVLALVLGCALASGCRAAASSRPGPRAALRIGTVADSPPLIFRHQRQWTGIEADLGRALAARMEMKPMFIAFPPRQLTAALLDGKVDILMAGMSVTEERRVQMDFSTPYLVIGQAALIRSADLLRYNTEIKIRATRDRVGVISNSTAEQLVAKYFTQAAGQVFPDAREAVEALRQGQIDILIHDAPGAWWLSLQSEGQLVLAPPLFAREEIAWAFRRSSVALRESANQALEDWQKSGLLESTLRSWIPVSY